jgi:transcriptional regulator with XRE-family HTH domain
MNNTEKTREILEKAFAEWRKLQTLKKGKISVSEFGKYLGYSQQAISFWLNKTYPISKEAKLKMAPKFAELLGNEIYEILELPMPDESKTELDNIWENLSNEKKNEILKIAKKFTKNDR